MSKKEAEEHDKRGVFAIEELCSVRWEVPPQMRNRMPTPVNCAICGHLCALEDCTMDERGRAVHYQCLADKILRQESEQHARPN